MRITGVCLYSNDVEITEFSFDDHSSNPAYTARAIIGLDADEIIPKFYGRGAATKTKYYSPAINNREIVIRIALNPKASVWETYSGLRDELYRGISSSRDGMIELQFMSGPSVVAAIQGFVTKFEAPLFTAAPEAQLTVLCEDGIFKSLVPVKAKPASLSLTTLLISDDESTSPHGMTFEVQFTATTPYFSIQDTNVVPEWKFKITPGTVGGLTNFQTGDRLFFTNEANEKSVFILRGATQYFLADKVELGSIWPIIFPGTNRYTIDRSTGAFQWNALSYYATYWGV